MADMKQRSEEQARLEREREEERKKREGSAYKTKEEREREANKAKAEQGEEGEARVIDDAKFDPKKDYYAILGLSSRAASSSEIRDAYKKFALLYHPDKHKQESKEQQEAIAQKFLDVAKAFDVLTNESMRSVYDKCRDYMDSNPGKGLPSLTPEEERQIHRGAGELSRLRRMGPKLKKHDPLNKQVEVTLENLNYGCTIPLSVERRRVDYSGKEFVSEKTFHLVIRRGSREGDTLVFEEEGNETVDTHAGDLVVTLRCKAHPVFRRSGDKDLEVFVQTENPNEILQFIEVTTLSKKSFALCLHSLTEALIHGGCGGTWTHVFERNALYDASDPWSKPAGDLKVSARYMPWFLEDKDVRTCISPGEVALLGSSKDVIPSQLIAGLFRNKLNLKLETFQMKHDYNTSRKGSIIFLEIFDEEEATQQGSSRAVTAMKHIFYSPSYTVESYQISIQRGLLDDGFWNTDQVYDLVIIDHPIFSASSEPQARSEVLTRASSQLQNSGILDWLWQSHIRGSDVVAIEGALDIVGGSNKIIQQYLIRPGASGFDDVCHALHCGGAGNTTCVGVLEGSAYVVDVDTGEAEMVVAPNKEALIRKAGWDVPADLSGIIDDADDDFGFMVAYSNA